MQDKHLALAHRVAERYAALPVVEAIAIGGSLAAGHGGEGSDIDLYVYTTQDIPAAERLAIGRAWSLDAEIVDFWGPGMEWDDAETGIHMDSVFFDTRWIEEQIARVLDRHEAWVGYTTCFWYTVRVSTPIFDRHDWFARLQEKSRQPYPDALIHAILRQDLPVLRDIFSSYRVQIGKAAARRDLVSLNHRVAGFISSYFDILFAVNRQPHPGEKRLLALAEQLCPRRPPQMRPQIEALLRSTSDPDAPHTALINTLVDDLEALLRKEGWL